MLAVSGRRDEPRHFAELDAMIFAQDHFVATTNGYSGYGTPGYFLLDRCTSLATLIGHYENVIRDPNLVDKMEYVRQTGIRLALEPCPISLDNGPAQEVTPVEAVDLRLRLLKISKLVSSVEFVVEITNTGPTVINTRSGRGHPLNLAWRFNPSTDVKDTSTAWQYRKELGFSLAPGETQEVLATGPIPADLATGFLQVTLVQENVSWLQDLGMSIASIKLPVR